MADYKEYNRTVKKHINRITFDSMDEGEELFSNRPQRKKNKNSNTPILDNFSVDVTKKASEGKIDPVIGRDDVIQRVKQILSKEKRK